MMLRTKYQDSWPCGFRQEDFFLYFTNISRSKTCYPQDCAIFGPHVHSLDKVGRGPLRFAAYQIQYSRQCIGILENEVYIVMISNGNSIYILNTDIL